MRILKRAIKLSKGNNGFTLIEFLVAIVILGVTIPTLMTPFSGLKDIKKPEYYVQASALMNHQVEALFRKAYDEIPSRTTCPVGTPCNCTTFQTNVGFIDLNCSNTDWSYTFGVENVDASDLGTSLSPNQLFKRITMVITNINSEIPDQSLYFIVGNF